MRPFLTNVDALSGFRARATVAVALIGAIAVAPFTYSNLVEGHPALGWASVAVIVVLLATAWQAGRGTYHPWATFAGLVPALSAGIWLGLLERGHAGLLWAYPSIMACYLLLPERPAWAANGILLVVGLCSAWLKLPVDLATRITATLLASSIFAAALVRVINRQQQLLETQACTDPLTGLANRQRLAETLQHSVEMQHRAGIPMTLLMIDIDHFKAINDVFGHDAGDRVLRGIGQFMKHRMRAADTVFRFGGEEFLVILTDTDAAHAEQLADQLRQDIGELSLVPDQSLHVSIGLAQLRNGETWSQWVKRADSGLLQAKASGRNRVCRGPAG